MLRWARLLTVAALVVLLAGCGGHPPDSGAPAVSAMTSGVALSPLAAPSDSVSGTTSVFRAVADTRLNQAAPTANYGTDTQLHCGNYPDGKGRRDLLRFDLSQAPAGAVVHKATLCLHVLKVDQGTDQYRVHRVTQPWTETGATWTSSSGAYNATASATAPIGPGDAGSAVFLDVTSLVEYWLTHPAKDLGCLIRGSEGGSRSGVRFASRESATPSQRPVLKVEWEAQFFTVSERCSYGPGGLISFAAYGGNGLRYLYSMGQGGGPASLLTPSRNDPSRTDEGGYQPTISPDGTRIAMTCKRFPQGASAQEDIFLIAAQGGESVLLQRLTTNPAGDRQPNWSPDGAQIVFSSDRTGTPKIFVMSRDGSDQHAVTTGSSSDQWPCFNPKHANQIAFSSDRAGAGNTDIYILHLNDATIGRVTSFGSREESPSWSRDGERILFHSNRAGDFDIWRINPDGTELLQVTGDSHSDGYPNWRTSDGGRFVFTRDRQVWTALPDGTDLLQLTRTY